MTAQLIDGKAIALELRRSFSDEVTSFVQQYGRAPCLSVIQVGHDPASDIYVSHKVKGCAEVGILSQKYFMETASREDVLALIAQLNQDPMVDGVLLQLPLPPSLNADEMITAISPDKDVDGLHPINQGHLFSGTPRFVPCTPLGCLHLIRRIYPDIAGKRAVVVGRSVLVGRPMASLLLNAHATVTIAHSKTQDLASVTQTADILVVAMGKPQAITGEMVKPGALVIDVGMNRLTTSEGRSKLVGDVDFDSVHQKAGYLTPVPGGVGPMTITFLLSNTIKAAYNRLK